MKLEVGQFVRTKSGIDKIIEIKEANKELDRYHIVTENNEMAFGYLAINKTIFVKDQLIDLIEVGDYVNSKKVVDKQYHYTDKDNYDMGEWCIFYENVALGDYQYDIKSIVTKEQFKSVEYEV